MIDEKKLIKEINECDFTADVNKMKANDNGPQLKGFYIGYTEMLLKLQPKVGEWIPCKERLPKYTDEYNVTVGVASELEYFEKVTTLRFERIKGEEPRWVILNNEVYYVIAWQPLPQPYKKGGAEND